MKFETVHKELLFKATRDSKVIDILRTVAHDPSPGDEIDTWGISELNRLYKEEIDK